MKKPLLISIIAKFILILLLSIGSGYFFFKYFIKPDTQITEEDQAQDLLTETFLSVIPTIQKYWFEGDFHNEYSKQKWNCPQLPQGMRVGSDYFKCNPDFLNCWIKGLLSDSQTKDLPSADIRFVELSPKSYVKRVHRINQQNQNAPRASVAVSFFQSDNEEKMVTLLLDDSCHLTYLPQRLYRYRLGSSDGDSILWDNFYRHFFLDKYLVTWRDIKDWKEDTGTVLSQNLADPQKWPLPADQLSDELQEQFCAWKGMRRMEAYLMDAATFLPLNIQDPMGVGSTLSYLPWSMGRPLTHEMEINQRECSLVYAKECKQQFPYIPYDKSSSSWVGIFQIMGGYPEKFSNSFEPDFQYKTSTFYVERTSPHHQLGLRSKAKKEGAFRCYLEVF